MSFDFNFTEDQLRTLLHDNAKTSEWFQALNDVLPRYEITSINRVAMFIAQTAHESANYTALQENLNYRAESLLRVWPTHFSADTVEEYAHNPEKIANCAYANRMGNGDEESGDGWRYHGRGLIQLTGKTNYEHFAASIGKSLEEAVEYCATPNGAVESACYFWKAHDLNAKSDDGDIEHVTRAINGGTLGLEDRTNRYNQALDLFQS